jgi:tetratricopeptide (TPR) repeat protein
MARVTLCMIARDEEQMLPGCLESVRGAVDEVVLVDTGSRDRTREVARAHGAQVYERPWDDDFAAPRNEALSRARGEYVLQLDADERLAPGACSRLRRAVEDGTTPYGLLRLHNASRADAPFERVASGELRLGDAFWVPRLVKRVPYVRYEGIIHETIDESLLRNGVRPTALAVDVVHLGRIPELSAARGKLGRNLALLEKRCRLEPDSIVPFGYLAMELYEAGRYAEAERAAEQGWALLDAQPSYRSAFLLASARASVALRLGRPERALETSQRFRERCGAFADLEYLRGSALLLLALRSPAGAPERAVRLGEAISALREILGAGSQPQNTTIPGVTSWATFAQLGHALLAAGHREPAKAAFSAALAASPAHVEARLGLAEVLLDSGDAGACLAAVEPLLASRPDAWLLAADAARALGADHDARLLFGRACERRREGYLAPHRRERHNVLVHLFAGGLPEDAAQASETDAGRRAR